MALSDCVNCWDTPCTCGWNWLFWSDARLEEMVKTLNGVIQFKRRHPELFPDNPYDLHDVKDDIMKKFKEELM